MSLGADLFAENQWTFASPQFDGRFIRLKTKTNNMSLSADLFAATQWTFVSPHFDSRLDYLFLDEAKPTGSVYFLRCVVVCRYPRAVYAGRSCKNIECLWDDDCIILNASSLE